MENAFAAADRFMLSQARLLERRLFATVFLGQPAARVVDALRGYQNDDGGFGHALERDNLRPGQPAYLRRGRISGPRRGRSGARGAARHGAAEFGAACSGMVERACDFLARTAKGASQRAAE